MSRWPEGPGWRFDLEYTLLPGMPGPFGGRYGILYAVDIDALKGMAPCGRARIRRSEGQILYLEPIDGKLCYLYEYRL